MTGGACGVVVPGVRVGTTEWERPARLNLAPDRTGRLLRSEAPVPTVGQVAAVVDAQLGSGLLRCLEAGCGGRLARGGFGGGGVLVGWGGGIERVRPLRALCAGCGVSRVLLPDSMLRRRQYGVEVIWSGLLAAARGRPWNQIAAELGPPVDGLAGDLHPSPARPGVHPAGDAAAPSTGDGGGAEAGEP